LKQYKNQQGESAEVKGMKLLEAADDGDNDAMLVLLQVLMMYT